MGILDKIYKGTAQTSEAKPEPEFDETKLALLYNGGATCEVKTSNGTVRIPGYVNGCVNIAVLNLGMLSSARSLCPKEDDQTGKSFIKKVRDAAKYLGLGKEAEDWISQIIQTGSDNLDAHRSGKTWERPYYPSTHDVYKLIMPRIDQLKPIDNLAILENF